MNERIKNIDKAKKLNEMVVAIYQYYEEILNTNFTAYDFVCINDDNSTFKKNSRKTAEEIKGISNEEDELSEILSNRAANGLPGAIR